HPDAGPRRVRADGAIEVALSGDRRDPDDREHRRSRRETHPGDPQSGLLLLSETVRPRSAQNARRTLRRTALAPRGTPADPEAPRNRDGRSARLSAKSAA